MTNPAQDRRPSEQLKSEASFNLSGLKEPVRGNVVESIATVLEIPREVKNAQAGIESAAAYTMSVFYKTVDALSEAHFAGKDPKAGMMLVSLMTQVGGLVAVARAEKIEALQDDSSSVLSLRNIAGFSSVGLKSYFERKSGGTYPDCLPASDLLSTHAPTETSLGELPGSTKLEGENLLTGAIPTGLDLANNFRRFEDYPRVVPLRGARDLSRLREHFASKNKA